MCSFVVICCSEFKSVLLFDVVVCVVFVLFELLLLLSVCVSVFVVICDGVCVWCEVVWCGDVRRCGRDATVAAFGDFAKLML